MIQDKKQRLRARMKELLREHRGGDSGSHWKSILSLPEWEESATVLIYSPLPEEVDPMPLLALHSSPTFLFPRVEEKSLGLYRYSNTCKWKQGPFGLKEPDSESWDQAYPGQIDLAIIPGVAFDEQGFRLGRGGGYYDRLLAHPEFRGRKIGLCWDFQLLPSIPREPHDIVMDQVISG